MILGWLVSLLSRGHERRVVTSELRELYEVRRRLDGAYSAARWHRRQLRRYAVQLLAEILRTIPHPRDAMHDLIRDLSYTTRRLARTPIFTLTIVLTLALGIGATTAVFNVVNGVLLMPLAFDEPERLVGMWHTWPGRYPGAVNMSPALYFAYREEGRVFEDIGMWDNTPVTVTGVDEPHRVQAMLVTDGTLPILRVRPLLGRLFTAEDDSPGTARTVILSHGYWRDRFGGDRGVVGRALTINGGSFEIVGVMGPELHFLNFEPGVYVPFRFDRARQGIGNFSFQALARLRTGFSIEDANADVARMIPLATEKFESGLGLATLREGGFGPNVRPLRIDVIGNIGDVLWVLLGTVGLVLLIACGNVANLLLVRGEGRQTEVAIRAALGASPARLAWESLLESVILGGLGGMVGLALARTGGALLLATAADSMPRHDEIIFDAKVVLFGVAVSLFTSALFGFLPLLRHGRASLAASCREAARGSSASSERHRARNTLVVAQVALALVLLVGAGLMIRSFQALRRVNPGFDRPEHVLTFSLSIPRADIEDPEQVARGHEQIMRTVAAIPGVESVGLASSVTMDGWDSNNSTDIEEFPTADDVLAPSRRYKWISPEYFDTMRNPVIAGRAFSWADIHDRAPVAVVTENLALEYWDSPAAALGKRITNHNDDSWRTIVGVVGNVHDDGAAQAATTVVFWPMVIEDFWGNAVFTQRSMVYAVRSDRVGTSALLDEVRTAVWSINPNLPLAKVQTMAELLDRSMARTSFTLVMLAIAATTALLLGAVGIYGVTSYVVSHRTREIGVRMALGANQHDVRRLILRHGLALAGIGVAFGLVGAIGLTRLMTALLFGVGTLDVLSYVGGALAVATLAILASYVPARRAARVDPLEALRWE